MDLRDQITKAKHEANHFGCVNTRDKTKEEIAHIDERFFLALEKLSWIKARRENKPEGFL